MNFTTNFTTKTFALELKFGYVVNLYFVNSLFAVLMHNTVHRLCARSIWKNVRATNSCLMSPPLSSFSLIFWLFRLFGAFISESWLTFTFFLSFFLSYPWSVCVRRVRAGLFAANVRAPGESSIFLSEFGQSGLLRLHIYSIFLRLSH